MAIYDFSEYSDADLNAIEEAVQVLENFEICIDEDLRLELNTEHANRDEIKKEKTEGKRYDVGCQDCGTQYFFHSTCGVCVPLGGKEKCPNCNSTNFLLLDPTQID